MKPNFSLCVYCGAALGTNPGHRAAARRLGQMMAARGVTLIYGGAQIGLMGALADAVTEGGGRVVGDDMAAPTTAQFILERLANDWGVRRIYGFPGDGINGIMGALDRAKDRIDFVQVRHEEMAAFMACAHAKFTGEVGVCMATSGPGAIHLLNGLYDAKMDHQPVVAIVGQQATIGLGGAFQQEVDLTNLFKDVAGAYVQQASVLGPECMQQPIHVIARFLQQGFRPQGMGRIGQRYIHQGVPRQ